MLASEPISICGVDVAAPQQLRARGSQQKMTISQLKSIFDKQFTPYEVRTGPPGQAAQCEQTCSRSGG